MLIAFFKLWDVKSKSLKGLPSGGEDVAVNLWDALGQLAADVDAPGGHRLATVHLHATHRPKNEIKKNLVLLEKLICLSLTNFKTFLKRNGWKICVHHLAQGSQTQTTLRAALTVV
jgi:hypothetical protein